jgi:hypothetical protein
MWLHAAVSAYGDTAAYWEYNFLWPLGQWDEQNNVNRLFPYFWGSTRGPGDTLQPYHIFFPFWWHFEDELNTFIPLWFVRHSNWQDGAFTEHSRWFGGPLTHFYDSPQEANWHVGPFGASAERDGSRSFGCYPFPLCVTWRNEKRSGLFTPVYAHSEADGEGWSLFPPLLYLHTWDDSHDDRWLGGPLARFRSGRDLNGWHVLPFFRYHSLLDDSDFRPTRSASRLVAQRQAARILLAALCVVSRQRRGRPERLVPHPPLLSWHTWGQEEDSYWLAGPLGHYRRDKTGQAWHAGPFGRIRSDVGQTRYSGFPWPLMFSWQTPSQKGLFTPLLASCEQTSSAEPKGWSVSPLLLSWHLWSGEVDDYWVAGPLAHLSRGGPSSSWHAGPFGHIHERWRRLLRRLSVAADLLVAQPQAPGLLQPALRLSERQRYGRGHGNSLLPPVLYWHLWTSTEDDHWLLGPLAHYRTGGRAGWLAFRPLRKLPQEEVRQPLTAANPWPLAFFLGVAGGRKADSFRRSRDTSENRP